MLNKNIKKSLQNQWKINEKTHGFLDWFVDCFFYGFWEGFESHFGFQNRWKMHSKIEQFFDRFFDDFLIENTSQMGGPGDPKIETFRAYFVTLSPWPLRGSKWGQNGPKWSQNDAKMEPKLSKNGIKNEGKWESLLGAELERKHAQNERKCDES